MILNAITIWQGRGRDTDCCFCCFNLATAFPPKDKVTENSEQSSNQQEYYNVIKDEVTMEETQIYKDIDNPDKPQNEKEMSPNVVYGVVNN